MTDSGIIVTEADREAAKALLDIQAIRFHETGTFRSWDATVDAFARHAAQARLEALEEAASFIEQRSDIHANSRTVLATAIRSLSTRGDQK